MFPCAAHKNVAAFMSVNTMAPCRMFAAAAELIPKPVVKFETATADPSSKAVDDPK
jgi:hypothetical protein